jgi:hypothetical protein
MKNAVLTLCLGLTVVALRAQTKATYVGDKATTTPSTTNTLSLEDTLKWLTDFLITATDAKRNTPDGRYIDQQATTLSVIDGCQVRMQTNIHTWTADGRQLDPGVQTAVFSLADIDPAAISVLDRTEADPPNLGVLLLTRNRSSAIDYSDSYNRTYKSFSINVTSFIDRAQADRGVIAFRHAVELCANPQPL